MTLGQSELGGRGEDERGQSIAVLVKGRAFAGTRSVVLGSADLVEQLRSGCGFFERADGLEISTIACGAQLPWVAPPRASGNRTVDIF